MAASVSVLTVYRIDVGEGMTEPAIRALVTGQAGTTVEWTDESINSLGIDGEVIVARGEYEDNQSLDLLLAAIYPGNGDPAVVPHMVLAYKHFVGEQVVDLYADALGEIGRQQILNWLTVWKPGAVAAATAQLTAGMTRQAAVTVVKQVIQPG